MLHAVRYLHSLSAPVSPDPTARAYLTIIDRAPEAVEKALAEHKAA